ncbi:glycosyltransferase family 4 protein [Leucobacter ruminantium]|uniref:Glycosyltransferase family 4 protein n=1 Tax=Leucobacter ruminantium TaxID=1289170 RepID=A0A939M0I0_9MICO|nr:glycosyltransferase family 4 protein [Leucobacter ruminantium]MBO1806478.1 glycosyltransferase family 4 protein [Leucobacter ruminantium]
MTTAAGAGSPTPERVVIVSRIYRPEPAAASLFLGSVADALLERGHEVEVLTVTAPRALGEGSRGERIRRFPVLRDRSGYVRGYVQYLSFDIPLAFRLLFARRPAVVLVEPPPTTGAVVRVLCALRRIPSVYDAADIWSDAAGHATSSGFVVRALRWVERFAMRGAAAMCTISEGVVGRVRELGVRTPMTVTGFGADTSVFRYVEAPIERVFLYAGTYTELHGAGILVDAFAIFDATRPGYRLRFIGNGTGREELRARAERLGIGDRVEFLEPVPAEALRPQLCGAVASLATLAPEGGYEYAFTSKAYSSLASGCPVIFSGPGPTAAFMREAAESAPVGAAVDYDAEAIADAMRDAADRPLPPGERRRLSDWAAAEHSMLATGRRVGEVVLGAARPGRRSS